MKTRQFYNRDGTISLKSLEYYNIIQDYVTSHKLVYTPIALDLAIKLHGETYRDGGAPYIVHPLEVASYLILLNVENAIFDQNRNFLLNDELAKEQTKYDLDVLIASALLHDTVEDCLDQLPEKGVEFVTTYQLPEDVLNFVIILTKDKTKPDFTLDGYYNEISKHWQTMLMKIADRVSNCSTIDSFKEKRMEKYVKETHMYFYNLISEGKTMYPDFSRIFTIMKYMIVSICESVASVLPIPDIIGNSNYEKTFNFIKGFAVGRGSMQNTLKALPLSKRYYNGLLRKSGDPFIVHPLRVCSYIISLKIDDDEICAAALLHEVIKKCNLEYNGVELVTKYNFSPTVLSYVRLLSNSEHYPLDIYYDEIKHDPKVLLLKLSNRANTCTTLINSSETEIMSYIEECEKYIFPLCEYGIKHYPQYSYSINIMNFHISSICNIVKTLKIN